MRKIDRNRRRVDMKKPSMAYREPCKELTFFRMLSNAPTERNMPIGAKEMIRR
jgi:hypothetical protein